jgi:hypothetical protein
MHDAIEPWLQVAHRDSPSECQPGLQQRVLQDILGPRIGEAYGVPAIDEQRPAIALDQGLEGSLVSLMDQREEPLIGLGGQ